MEEALLFYAAVVNNRTILAEYRDTKSGDFYHTAVRCLEHIPPFHSKFSFTTRNRRFICLIEGLYIYCAVTDEALNKTKAFMFLEHVRDAFNVLLQQRDMHADSLSRYCLHHDMGPFFRHLASPLVGIPQREKIRLQEEEHSQAQSDTANEDVVSSPSAVAPLKETSDEDLDYQTELKPVSGCSRARPPALPFIGKMKRNMKKTKDYKKGVMNSPSCEALNKGNGLDIMVDNSIFEQGQTHRSGCQNARESWWRHARLCLFFDLLFCCILLVIFFAVCTGVDCLKRN